MELKKLSKRYHTMLSVILLTVVAVLLISVVLLVRIKLLQNAQAMGMALVRSCALEEEMNIDTLEKNAVLVSQYVEEISASGGDREEIQEWLIGYFAKLEGIMGKGMVDPYAVMDGVIVAANPWEGDQTYQYQDTEWYQAAIEADGEVVCGDVYTDAITGRQIFTVSKKLSHPGDVFAMDVYVGNDNFHNTAHTLPEECSYYLCDQDGSILYSMTNWDVEPEKLQEYANYIMEGIRDGSLLAYDASFKDMYGVSRGAYYEEMSNGWTVIMTIPIDTILMGDKNLVVYAMAGVAVLLFAVITVMTIRDGIQNRRMKKADDTAHLLGDSFYSIFRVNFRDGTYEALKIYEDMGKIVPAKGDYERLLHATCTFVKSNTYEAFESSFSLESIRRRVDQKIADYGGDYQRRFGDVYRWVNVRTLYDPQLAPDEVILCFRDVDEEKRREMEYTVILQEALSAAQKSVKAKSEFFSRMSHDMRTPLNAIVGCCTLAEKNHVEGDHSKVWEHIKKIEFAGNQLLGLVNDILELSRMEAGKNSLEQKEFDLEALLVQITDIFHDRAEEEGKTLEYSIDLGETRVIGDEKKISQIINNLLSNAVKYSRPGDKVRLEARRFAFQEHSKYQIIVEDTGIGMSPEFLKHLFEPYSRETTFGSQTTVGTGLGMAIVKSLVQQMSGEIWVDSTLGEGSRFTVTLPLKTVQTQERAGSADAAVPAPSFDWAGRKILVAEDNDLNREIITEILEEMGAEVIPAVNGAEAVRTFMAAPVYSIDAILMDMQMPEMDGCQAASTIRGLGREDAEKVPIIAVTANAFAEDIARTTQAGMNDHVSKPIDMALLGQILQKLVGEWDARKQRSVGKEKEKKN